MNTLLEAKEDGIRISITSEGSDSYRLRMSVAYNFGIAYQRNWVSVAMQRAELASFVEAVKNGTKSFHGKKTWWQTNGISLAHSNTGASIRSGSIRRRFLIFGFLVPFYMPRSIVTGISGVEV